MIYNAKYIRLAKQTDAFRTLSAEFAQGRESHAYLLASPDTLLSLSVVAGVVCEGKSEKLVQRILNEKCSDFKTYDKLTKDEAMEICDGSMYSASELNGKYFVVNATENNDSGQNKILKTLEEAPYGLTIFLIAPTVTTLLPTIVSRCQLLEPRLIKEIDETEFDFSLYFEMAKYGAKNNLTVFDRLLGGTGASLFSSAVRAVSLLAEGRALEAFDLFPNKREELSEFLGYLETIFGDGMQVACGRKVETYGIVKLSKVAEAFPKERYPQIFAEIRRARKRATSGNLTSVIDTLIISIIGGE
ncbi:MAG: hypothetical protein IKM44_03335 [Clostridia bacterium]|nr:hypothetical protein [Clostridia bacterium]